MHKKNLSSKVALLAATSLLSAGVFAADSKEGSKSFVKCYGIAKAHQNSCAACNRNACQGQATKDNSPYEWVLADSAKDCENKGGKLESASCSDDAASKAHKASK